MNERYLDRDIELISAYIDSRLSPAETSKVKARLQSEPQLNQLLRDLTYTRKLLRALPKKRAPRNFTLSAEYAPAPRRAIWLQPALSIVSMAAAATLIVLFASSYLLGGGRTMATKAPAPQAAEMRAVEEADAAPPAIINWNPVYGMGGGGGDPYTGGVGGGGAGGPGWDLSAPVVGSETAATESPVAEMPTEPTPTPEGNIASEEAPLTALAEPEAETPAAKTTGGEDLSTMILGLPDESVQGEVIVTDGSRETQDARAGASFPMELVMIVSGVIAVLSGLAALLLRRQ
jgi:hypothetical protein